MIHVVTLANQHLYGHQLDQMFRMRKSYYVDDLNWGGIASVGNRETDEFDDGDVVYLINIDRFGDVAAVYRANPSTGPNLMGDKLPHYLEGDPIRRDDVWDLSRWMLAKKYRSHKNAAVSHKMRMELACGVMEFAVSRGLTAFSGVIETAFLARLGKSGWPYKRLGPPIEYEAGKGEAIAVLIEAGPHVLAATRASGQIYHNVLFEITAETLSEYEAQTEAALRDAMARAGKAETQEALRSLTDEIARLADIDPGGSIAVIHGFQETLTQRLSSLSTEDERLTG